MKYAKKVTGVIGKYDQQGHVVIDIEPDESGTGPVFVNKIKDDVISHEFINSIKEGIEFGAQNGILSGYLVSDFVVTLIDASCHDVNSDVAFQLGKNAIKEAFRKAGSVYQEPIMKLEVSVPDDYWGDVTSDLMKRRGQIKETGTQDKLKLALADVPLAEFLGYSKVLNQLTKGQATFSMEFSFYAIAQNKRDEGTSGMAGKISPKFPPYLGGKAERLFEE